MTDPTKLPFRFTLFFCAIVSLLLSNGYRTIGDFNPPTSSVHVPWWLFSLVLRLVGGFAAILAILPASFVKKYCKIGADGQGAAALPIKLLIRFAVFSFLLTLGLYFVPLSWSPGPKLVFSLCPSCALTFAGDPSFAATLLELAPINAAVYGSLGAALGYIALAIRNRKS